MSKFSNLVDQKIKMYLTETPTPNGPLQALQAAGGGKTGANQGTASTGQPSTGQPSTGQPSTGQAATNTGNPQGTFDSKQFETALQTIIAFGNTPDGKAQIEKTLQQLKQAPTAGQAPAGQAPAGQAPAGQAPAGQAPAGKAPAGQAVIGQRRATV